MDAAQYMEGALTSVWLTEVEKFAWEFSRRQSQDKMGSPARRYDDLFRLLCGPPE